MGANILYAAANDERFEIKAVNFSGYGASFVYLDKHDRVIPPCIIT